MKSLSFELLIKCLWTFTGTEILMYIEIILLATAHTSYWIIKINLVFISKNNNKKIYRKNRNLQINLLEL